MRIIITTITISAFLMFLISSCGDNIINSPDEVVFPDSNVSYQKHVQPLMNLTCALSTCHDDVYRQGNFSLKTHQSTLFDRVGLVIPGNPDGSLLIQTIEKKQSCLRTDVWIGWINKNHEKGMRTWVAEGALNN